MLSEDYKLGWFVNRFGKRQWYAKSRITGKFVKLDKRKAFTAKKYRRRVVPRTQIIRYTRSVELAKGGGNTPQAKIDVIIEEREPLGMSDEEITKKLGSKEMENRMLKF